MPDTIPGYLKTLAEKTVERCDALGFKGKKADQLALDYWCGAAQGLSMCGDAIKADHISRLCALVIAVRGMFEVRRLASLPAHREV